MIEISDRDYLVDVLVEVLAGQDAPRATLCIVINDIEFATELALNSLPVALVTQAVELCIGAGRRHTPPWLERLVTSAVLGTHVGSAQLQRIEQQIRAFPAPQDTAGERKSTLLKRKTPFVNRKQLRRALVHLETAASREQPIFVVNGPSGSGKSYTRLYVEHFIATRVIAPRITPHYFRFQPDQALALGPVHLAKELVSSLGRDPASAPAPDTNLKLYVAQLAAWVLNEAVRSGRTNWFILDGFRVDDMAPDSARPRADTMDLLIALSDKITSGTYMEQCRLIFTGFNRSLLTVDPGKLDEELIDACTDKDIEACVAEALSVDGLVIPIGKVKALVADQLPGDSTRMYEVNSRLRLLAHAVSRLREILPTAPADELEEWLLEMLGGLPLGDLGALELKRRLDALETTVEEEGV